MRTVKSLNALDLTDERNLLVVIPIPEVDLKHRKSFPTYNGARFVVYNEFGLECEFKTADEAEAFVASKK